MLRLVDVVVTAVEINERHGVGAYLKRLFSNERDVVSIRSCSMYGGRDHFGDAAFQVRSKWLTDGEVKQVLSSIFQGYEVRRILCVPYFQDDFRNALCLKELTGAPLCLYLMDDQNVFSNQVTDEKVAALWQKADLRLAISNEMASAYSRKYGDPVHVMPPVLTTKPAPLKNYWKAGTYPQHTCAMIGNVWSSSQFTDLRKAVKSARLRVEWYGSGSRAPWLAGKPAEWERDGIFCVGHAPEEDLGTALAGYQCVLIPSGTMDSNDDKLSFSRLSLPSRIVSMTGLAATPQLVLGHSESAAARFVRSQGIGACCDYTAHAISASLTYLQTESVRNKCASDIKKTAASMYLPDALTWIWRSLGNRRPENAAFQTIPAFNSAPPAWLGGVEAYCWPCNGLSSSLNSPQEARFSMQALSAANEPTEEGRDGGIKSEHTNLLEQFLGLVLKHDLMPLHGRNILFLGSEHPTWRNDLPANARLWTLDNIRWLFDKATWPLATIKPLLNTSRMGGPRKFDIIVSQGCLNHASDAEAVKNLSHFIDGRLNLGGISFHLVEGAVDNLTFTPPFAYSHLSQNVRPCELIPISDRPATNQETMAVIQEIREMQVKAETAQQFDGSRRPAHAALTWQMQKGQTRRGIILRKAFNAYKITMFNLSTAKRLLSNG
jgi:hypothetical protein